MSHFYQHLYPVFSCCKAPLSSKELAGSRAARWLTAAQASWVRPRIVVRPWQRAQAHCPRHNLWQGRCRAQAPNTGEGTWRCC